MVGPVETATARLFCTRPPKSSGSNYERLFMDPTVERWLRPAPLEPFAPADLERLLRHDRSHWQIHGFGPWALVDRETGEFAGRAGLAWTRVEGREAVELPWAILPEFQRQGLASEAGISAIEVARKIGLAKVVSLALVDNVASRGVMEKIGLEFTREVDHVGLPHALYELELE
ncbi:MAG: GNAT family N-acetyltransferase [Thermoleophilia bacterium]|nr:GNAT family N-acetyltransferase [Thermoleophilia bacterium]